MRDYLPVYNYCRLVSSPSFLAPPLQIKAGRVFTVNCLGIMCVYIITLFSVFTLLGYIIGLAGAKIYDVESLRRRVHCSLPLRQLSELGYLLQCFNSFICHLRACRCHFGKLLRKTSVNFFGKLPETPKTTSETSENFGKYRRKLQRPKSLDENSQDRSLWKVFLNFLPPYAASGRNAQRRQGK